MDNKLPEEAKCSGCGACLNVCPVNAITMQYEDGFFVKPVIDEEKCINCGLCSKTCPIFNPIYDNDEKPVIYSYCADDATRKVSSSGGIFSSLADYVLAKGGSVCGAAFDDDMQLKHIIVDSEEGLNKLRKSKYLQSETGMIYKQIKKLLDLDKDVLFVGTPCQVAALKAVLKKKYEKLITADLLCHGVPSQLLFNKYLNEVAQGKKVVNVDFRSKRFGWSYTGVIVTYDDNTEYIGKIRTAKKDPYCEAFIKNMMMRDVCYDCKFNNYPRQGDFTIGDLWGVEKIDPPSNDKKGTSIVFLNNQKAINLFAEIAKKSKYHKELVELDHRKVPNRIGPKTKVSPNRARFLELLKTRSFSEAFEMAYYQKYDIGMPGVIYNENIGSVLTYYALYNTLTEMNYSVLPIERPLNAPLECSDKAKAFTKRWLPAYAQPVQRNDLFDMRQLNDVCDQFLVGSDQIFLAGMSENRNHCYFLQWVEDNKKKMGYASSFGGPGARGTEAFYRELKYYLNRFNFLSCREEDGVKFANNELKLKNKVEWCLDPVFLCDKENYLKLVRSVKKDRTEEYIGSYVVIPKGHLSSLIRKTKEHFGINNLELIGDGDKLAQAKEFKGYKYADSFPISKSLELIHNCRFFVTDSFHGVCFAIIFRKDFLVIPRDFHDRFTSILNKIGLGDRIITAAHSNLTDASFEPIDYDKVYEKLQVEIDKSKKMLKDALEQKVADEYTDMDILMQYIKKQDDSINLLKQQLEKDAIEIENLKEQMNGRQESSLFMDVVSQEVTKMSEEEKNDLICRLEKDNMELRHVCDKYLQRDE